MSNSMKSRTYDYSKEATLPLLDLSPYCPEASYSASLASTETDFLSISCTQPFSSTTVYPMRALTSESSNLFYLAHDTTLNNDWGYGVLEKNSIIINYKLCNIKPAALYIRTGITYPSYFCKEIEIYGIKEDDTEDLLGSLTSITQVILFSGVWARFTPEQMEAMSYYKGLRIYLGTANASNNNVMISQIKIYGQPDHWDKKLSEKYSQHILSNYHFAVNHALASSGLMHYAEMGLK